MDNTPELVERLVRSWDQCTDCTTDADRSVDAADLMTRKEWSLS